jgi:hypothetical protein
MPMGEGSISFSDLGPSSHTKWGCMDLWTEAAVGASMNAVSSTPILVYITKKKYSCILVHKILPLEASYM